MTYTLLKTAHVLAIVVWVGGMVFAHFCLRPAVAALEPPQRLRLMHDVLGRFFALVAVASLAALASGLALIALAHAAGGGGFAMPASWSAMSVLGTLMVGIFGYVRLAPFARLRRAVAAADWPAAGAAMARIRVVVAGNLALGGVTLLAALLRLPA